MSAKLESLGALVDEAAADPEVQNLLANSATLWVPVITASVEDRSAKVSSQDSPDHKQQWMPMRYDVDYVYEELALHHVPILSLYIISRLFLNFIVVCIS